MRIQNEIEVAASPEELFDVLSDVERVAPLLPGATLEGKEGDAYTGAVKVKVGPITASYRGRLRFVELDEESHRAVMEASAQETNGQGNAQAKISASVSGSDSQSVLSLDTDLEVRGKAAQFGRGVLGNVSQRILDQFARNLESEVLSSRETEEEPPSEEGAPTEEAGRSARSEEHTSELQSRQYLVCRLLLEKKKKNTSSGRSLSPARNCASRSGVLRAMQLLRSEAHKPKHTTRE